MRRTSLEQLQSVMQACVPNVSIADLQAKFQSLKQNAVKEYKKHLNSMKSGAGEEEIYMPSLWYFDIIRYVLDGCLPRESIDTISVDTINTTDVEDSIIDGDGTSTIMDAIVIFDGDITEEPILDERVADETTIVEQTPTTSTHKGRVGSTFSDEPKSNKKKDNDHYLQMVSTNLAKLNTTLAMPPMLNQTQKEEMGGNELFASFVAKRMDEIDDLDIRDDVEEKIMSVLREGLRRNRQKKNE
ncbi:uncharacterized protein LOC126883287 [Diabrotica virgifera virgifera]|uniref:MADF domain-containing protein n=1 Tax=Diabrotica virgifera virgifera TaxID=50390 RepID=A0ABM5K322_DIAVI|nr:uncharacterized protein LOC126883287 [Diabrotica virgifera virgifera]